MRADEKAEVAEIFWRSWHESHAPFIPRPIVEHRTRDYFVDRVGQFERNPVVAVEDARLLGFVVWVDDRLDQLWVLPEARRRGIGSRLLDHAEAEMAAAGQRRLRMVCRLGNEGARRLYERRGWSVVGQYDKPLGTADGEIGVPVWQMEKALAAPGG